MTGCSVSPESGRGPQQTPEAVPKTELSRPLEGRVTLETQTMK